MDIQTLRLKDGRTLGYREFGKAGGIPVIFLPGSPCVAIPHSHEVSAQAQETGIRLVAIERPGYNLSDFQQDRTLMDHTDDIAQVADHLGADRFGVFGWSGGAPYTVACAYKLPERLTLALALSSPAPYDAFGTPDEIPTFEQLIAAAERSKEAFANHDAFLEGILQAEPESSGQFLQTESAKASMRDWLDRTQTESFRNGPEAFAWELKLYYAEPWGFKLNDNRGNVQIWHGELDKNVDLKNGEYLATHIPNCDFRPLEGVGHVPLPEHTKLIFEEFLKAAQ